VGAIQGIFRYYVQPELTAKRGWVALAAGVAAYDLLCPPGETLSEGCDRGLETNRALTLGIIGVTALHLANVLPPQLDPFSQTLKFIKGNHHEG
jgi:hypothetical protein